MKKSLLSILVGSAVSMVPQIASATLLVGYSDFDAATNTENADYALGGFSGTVIDGPSEVSYNTGGSNDGTLGGSSFAEFTPGASDGYLRTIGSGDPIIQVTNNSSQSYGLTSLLFDAANQGGGNTLAVTYRLGTSGTWLSLYTTPKLPDSGSAGASVDFGDYLKDLVGLDITLLGEAGITAANTIQFKFDGLSNARIDNIGLTGLSAIPEPASVVALACLLGSGMFLRQRRGLHAQVP